MGGTRGDNLPNPLGGGVSGGIYGGQPGLSAEAPLLGRTAARVPNI